MNPILSWWTIESPDMKRSSHCPSSQDGNLHVLFLTIFGNCFGGSGLRAKVSLPSVAENRSGPVQEPSAERAREAPDVECSLKSCKHVSF